MITRNTTKKVKIGNIHIGGQNKVLIQSMCNIKTEKVKMVSKQINKCASLGADMMRVSIKDEKDAKAIKKIKQLTTIPIIGDVHFNYKLAIKAIENGIDKIRINPDNISKKSEIYSIIDKAKQYGTAIRLGFNSGSLKFIKENYTTNIPLLIVKKAKKYIKFFEEKGFNNLVISLKCSNLFDTISCYELASKTIIYPLHVGITESGIKDISLIRSSACLSPLLLRGIGDTIRISITGDPYDEIIAAKRLLHDLNLYDNYPTIISCPTCGRTEVNVKKLTLKVLDYLEKSNKNITIAIMGCVVNGPGEAKNADIGIAGGKNVFIIFKKGKILKKVDEETAFEELKKEIEKD